jgi:sulfite exporter TauE/SafE
LNFYEYGSLELLAILAFGFFGSLGHCVGMCGGFIVSYTTAKMDASSSKTSQASGHAFYNLGRISSYTLLGALFGFFGSLWEATPMMRMVMFGFSGLLMILMGLSLSGKLKFLSYLEYPITQKKWFKTLFFSQLNSKSRLSFYTLGALNGFFPCGLVYTMLITAIATKSALLGATVMLLFGISTIPTLFSLGFLVGFISQNRFRHIMMEVSSLIIVLYGGWTLYKAYINYDIYLHPIENSSMKCGSGKCGAGKCGL